MTENSLETPLVSIAMTTYNAGRFLDGQIRSLLDQTYPNIEIVIADDGSDDGTFERVKEYASTNAGIRVLPQSEHLGFNGNFMRCFRECRGEWICPCDQDDIWEANKTSRLVEKVPPDGLAWCDSSFIDDQDNPIEFRGGRRMSDKFQPENDPPVLGLLMRSCASGHALIFPRQMMDDIPDVPGSNYFDHWITIWARANDRPMGYVHEALIRYRRHDESVVGKLYTPSKALQKTRTLEQRWALLATLKDRLETPTHRQEIETFLNVFQHWLNHFFSLRAFLFFKSRQQLLFRRETAKQRRKKVRSYLVGYRLRSTLRPKRYPPVVEHEGATLRFDLKE